MKKWIFSLLLIFVIQAPLCAENLHALKGQADSNMLFAFEMINKSKEVLASPMNKENFELAVDLQIKAGKLFEESAKIYESLIPANASETDVDNAKKGLQLCMANLAQLRQQFAKLHHS